MTSTVWMGAQTLDSQDNSNSNKINNNNNSKDKETTSPGSFGSLVWSLVSRWMTLGRHSSHHDQHDQHDHCTCTCGRTHSSNLSLDLLQPINAAIAHLSEQESQPQSQAVSADLESFHAGLVRHSICTPAEIHLALVYARRLQLSRSGCKTTEQAAVSVSLGPATWVALVLLACKQLQDEPYDNSAFAQLACMSLTCLNRLERALLVALDYRLLAHSDELLCLACALAPL